MASKTVECPRCRRRIGRVGNVMLNHRPGCDIGARPEQLAAFLDRLRVAGLYPEGAAAHSARVEQAGPHYRAVCSCGWRSATETFRTHAAGAADWHTGQAAAR